MNTLKKPQLNNAAQCLKYLEEHGGRLAQIWCKTAWPSGKMTEFVWRYESCDRVVFSQTAIDAIREHMARTKRR